MIDTAFYKKRRMKDAFLYENRFDEDTEVSYAEYQDAIIAPFGSTGPWQLEACGGVFTSDGTFIPETQYTTSVTSQDIDVCGKNTVTDISGEQVIFLGTMIKGWGHALTDDIQRLWFLLSEEYQRSFSDCKLVYIPVLENGETVEEYCEKAKALKCLMQILGVDFNRLEPVRSVTRFASVIIPDASFKYKPQIGRCYTKEYRMLIDRIREFQKQHFTLETRYKKVYYTCRQYKKSGYIGEKKLEDFFSELGYTIVAPEKYSVAEQLNILANCDEFASTEGSCSHNSIFLPKSAHVYLIPRFGWKNDYQAMINHLNGNDVTYIYSAISILTYFNRPWNGTFYFYVSKNLFKAFDKDIPDGKTFRTNNFYDLDEYLSQIKDIKELRGYQTTTKDLMAFVRYAGFKNIFRFVPPLLIIKVSRRLLHKNPKH